MGAVAVRLTAPATPGKEREEGGASAVEQKKT
jgi:hypothetical protein